MATIPLNADGFKEKIFDFESATQWQYTGPLPAVIDFYAEWCGPCKAIAPLLEEIADEYAGRILVYKIDTDQETELSALFGIQSIPTLLFIPMQGPPMMQRGALPKNILKEVINEKLIKSTTHL